MSESNYSILIVDDDPLLLEMYRALLGDGSHEVVTFENPKEALEYVKQYGSEIGIIISDVSMPEIDGYEFCDEVKNNTPTAEIPVIFVSAMSTLEEKIRGFAVGADDYIIKPVEKEELLKKVDDAITRKSKLTQLSVSASEAREMAMKAMSFSGELGMVIDVYNKLLAAKDYQEMAAKVFEAGDYYNLTLTLQIHTPTNTININKKGSVSPLEANVIELARKKARFFDFGTRTCINYNDFSLLIKNMPLEDPEKYGRIKDIMGMITNGIESKIHQLNQQKKTEKHQEIVKSIQDSLQSIERSFSDIQKENVGAIEDMNDQIKEAIMVLGLMEYQEENIEKIVTQCLEKINSNFYRGINVKENLENIDKQFHRILPE